MFVQEGLLSSIHAQLQHYLTHAREHERAACGDAWAEEAAPDALALRFSLAGGMFDAVRRSYQLTTDWAVLLAQLLTHQLVDAYNNRYQQTPIHVGFQSYSAGYVIHSLRVILI